MAFYQAEDSHFASCTSFLLLLFIIIIIIIIPTTILHVSPSPLQTSSKSERVVHELSRRLSAQVAAHGTVQQFKGSYMMSLY